MTEDSSQTSLVLGQSVGEQRGFTFRGHDVRVVVFNGEPWFVATDIAKALGIVDTSNLVQRVRPHQKGKYSTRTQRGHQECLLGRQGGQLVPYENHRSAGRFTVKMDSNEHGASWAQVYVTPKGELYIAKLLAATPVGEDEPS